MNETNDLLSMLHNKMPELSKGQKRIANFLIEHYDKAVYLTASKLGEIAGVSESTVVRFAIELGYDGYPKLQRAVEELVKNKLTASQRMEVSYDRMQKEDKHILKAILEGDEDRIHSTLNDIDTDEFDKAIEYILKAKRIYIVGGRSASALSNFLSFYLNLMLDNVINASSSTTTETFEQIALSEETIGDALKFVKENEMVTICSHNGDVFAIEPPLFVELEITESEPGVKGNTATGATKPAVVETGATVYVPLFVNQGEKIKIDTRTGEYLSRV